MSDLIDRQKILNTLDFVDKACIGEERTVEKYKELLTECIKVLPSAENDGDLISRERLINEWDDLGRRYAMPTTPIHKRAIREFPSADMRGKAEKIRCNTCKNNDDELSGECYECIKGIFDHYEPQESEDKE